MTIRRTTSEWERKLHEVADQVREGKLICVWHAVRQILDAFMAFTEEEKTKGQWNDEDTKTAIAQWKQALSEWADQPAQALFHWAKQLTHGPRPVKFFMYEPYRRALAAALMIEVARFPEE